MKNDREGEGSLDGPRHDDKLGAILWRTLDRIERSVLERQIDVAEARQVIELVTELTQALPSSSSTRSRLHQLRSSWIQPRTHGNNA